METEDVYSAVLRLFKSRSLEVRWRIVVESDVRIILEKRSVQRRQQQQQQQRRRIDVSPKRETDDIAVEEESVRTPPVAHEKHAWIKREEEEKLPELDVADLDLADSGGEWGGASGRDDSGSSPEIESSSSSSNPFRLLLRCPPPPPPISDGLRDRRRKSPSFSASTRRSRNRPYLDPYVALYPCDDIIPKKNADESVATRRDAAVVETGFENDDGDDDDDDDGIHDDDDDVCDGDDKIDDEDGEIDEDDEDDFAPRVRGVTDDTRFSADVGKSLEVLDEDGDRVAASTKERLDDIDPADDANLAAAHSDDALLWVDANPRGVAAPISSSASARGATDAVTDSVTDSVTGAGTDAAVFATPFTPVVAAADLDDHSQTIVATTAFADSTVATSVSTATAKSTTATSATATSATATSATAKSANATSTTATSAAVDASTPMKGRRMKLDLPRCSYSGNGPDNPKRKRSIRRIVKKPCPLCKRTNYGNKYLRTHIKRCHPGFMTQAEEEEEAKRDLAERTCNICFKTFTTKGGFTIHMREIHLRDSLEDRTCPFCGKELSSRRRREEHIAKTHQADRVGGPFPCQVCSKLFATKEQVRSHLRYTCPMNRKAVECPICGRKYRHEEGIRYHLLTEHADAGYKPENDNDHKLLALKATCYVCGKEMKRFSLKNHIAHVHQGIERNMTCQKCVKTFSTPAAYRRHMRDVHQEKPALKTCQKCHKTFSSLSGLKNHMRGVHMGIRNQCDVCPSSFFSKKDLKEHVSSVHLGNKHQCSHCPRDFNRRSELNRHKRNIHHIDTAAEQRRDRGEIEDS